MMQHLQNLQRKHEFLETLIHEEQLHPSSDDLAIRRLKMQRLDVKRQIERLREARAG